MHLDKRKVDAVVHTVIRLLADKKEYGTVESIFGLAELAGRLIARSTPGTWVEKRELLKAVFDHMEITVKAGVDQPAEPSRIILIN